MAASSQVDDQALLKSGPKKIVQICIDRAERLTMAEPGSRNRKMEPFFAYSFYTFEYTSPTVTMADQNNNYEFGSQRTFEVESNKDFEAYLQKETLKIELIDESVELTDATTRDYIGTVRIPLIDLVKHKSLTGTGRYMINDDLTSNNTCVGELVVRM